MEEPEVRIVGPEIGKLDGYLRDVVGWKVSVVLTHVHHSYSLVVTIGSLVLPHGYNRVHSVSLAFTVGVTNIEDVESVLNNERSFSLIIY